MLLRNLLKDTSQFTNSELEIVKYIMKDPKKVANLTIEELALETFSSPSCIVRFSKKLGLKGFSDFKIKLATEINSFCINDQKIQVDIPVGPLDGLPDIANTFLNLHHRTLTETYNNIDLDMIQAVVNVLQSSDGITMFGVGPSLVLIQDFIYKAGRLGLPFFHNPLIGFENVYRNINSKKPVSFVISHFAQSSAVKNWVLESKDRGIPVILLCANRHSPLLKVVEYPILIDNEEDRFLKLGSFASRTSFLFVLDVIYSTLFVKDFDSNIKKLLKTQKTRRE